MTSIFLHIEKTAGRSINKMLDDHFGPDLVLHLYPGALGENVFDAMLKLRKGIKLVVGHVDFGVERIFAIDAPTYFTFVREPVSRLWSEYAYFKRRNAEVPKSNWRQKNFIVDECSSALDFCVSESRVRNPMVSRVCGKLFGGDVSLDGAKSNVEQHFSFVGVTEEMSKSLKLMEGALGGVFAEAPRLNAAPPMPMRRGEQGEVERAMRDLDAFDFAFYDWCRSRL